LKDGGDVLKGYVGHGRWGSERSYFIMVKAIADCRTKASMPTG